MSGNDPLSMAFTRRHLMKTGAAGAFVLGSGGLLAACGGDDTNRSEDGSPKRGGTLTASSITGGQAETLDPGHLATLGDTLRGFLLFNVLFRRGVDNTPVPELAVSAESNAEATIWNLKLRDGVTWHDGKPFTADDVVYSFRTAWADPTHLGNSNVAVVDLKRVRKRGPLDVEVPLRVGVRDFPTMLTAIQNGVIRAGGTDFAKPIGTGPFKFESFTPGKQSVFVANPDYWENGKPYVDRVVVDSSFTEENARLNALLGGQVHLVGQMGLALAKQADKQRFNLLRSPGPGFLAWTMRCSSEPFSDVRVRQAMRLAVDRKSLIDRALNGFGRVQSDLMIPSDPNFASDLKREQDIEQAKSLLKSAGKADLRVTLATSPTAPGLTEASTLLKEQAAAAGIEIKLDRLDPGVYYTEAAGYASRPFGETNWSNPISSMAQFYSASSYTKSAYRVETDWASPEHDEALLKAMGASEENATEAWREYQQLQFDTGGYIVWNTRDNLDGVASAVRGLKPSQGGNLGNFRLQDAWLA